MSGTDHEYGTTTPYEDPEGSVAGTEPVAGSPTADATSGLPPQAGAAYYDAAPGNPAPGATPSYGPFHNTAQGWNPTPDATPPPASGADPTSAPPGWPTPTSGAGVDQYGLDIAGPDRFGPTSGAGAGTPAPFAPGSGAGTPAPFAPTSGAGAALPDRFGFEPTPAYSSGPRIEPTPKQPRGRFLIPALIGLTTGLLIFGTGGWFLGRSTAPNPKPAPAAPTAAPAPTAQGVYEQNQIAINQPKFAGPLGPVAQGWLPYLSGCSRSGEKDGPKPGRGEKVRVRCEMDAMSVIFVEYATTADRDKARVTALGQNVDARTLTPGVGPTAERATPSGRTNGNYVEYAYQVTDRTVAGIWWDDTATPVAAYLLAYWEEGTGEKWDPMRDVWARYA
ncbi:hypothetical protein AB0368_17230 [Actinoplanes sp. NPDC051475]|uniref:hypothetical protein n=1 Tax=Actinoplanes sp. NPDC051475 TaxID=3157225 RepID=UPI00344CDF48